MLEIRPFCENCARKLPCDSTEAMICSFECTFCAECVAKVLYNVCPNCGGGFEKRPVRPQGKRQACPNAQSALICPVHPAAHAEMRKSYEDIAPHLR